MGQSDRASRWASAMSQEPKAKRETALTGLAPPIGWTAPFYPPDQRFENWKLRRALRLPYFLRSTTRESRVKKPAAFRGVRSTGS